MKHHSLALALQSLAVKPVIQTSSVVTLFITLPVVEIKPALQRGRAVLPRVDEVQRAVPSIPIAGVVITGAVANLVGLLLKALWYLAADRHLRSGRDVSPCAASEAVVQDVAEEAIEAAGADAVVVRSF